MYIYTYILYIYQYIYTQCKTNDCKKYLAFLIEQTVRIAGVNDNVPSNIADDNDDTPSNTAGGNDLSKHFYTLTFHKFTTNKISINKHLVHIF